MDELERYGDDGDDEDGACGNSRGESGCTVLYTPPGAGGLYTGVK